MNNNMLSLKSKKSPGDQMLLLVERVGESGLSV